MTRYIRETILLLIADIADHYYLGYLPCTFPQLSGRLTEVK